MFSLLGNVESRQIDDLAREVCTDPSNYGELQQLRTLFSPPFLQGLEDILYDRLKGSRAGHRHVEVSLGWIDKIPLARSDQLGTTPPMPERTELGDAIVLAVDQTYSNLGLIRQQSARAVLLQAKVARTGDQVEAPTVPLTAASSVVSASTRKELALLSAWPRFDLFKSSGSKTPRLTDVDLPSASPESYGWYLAAPGRPLTVTAKHTWPSWWMAGRPATGAPCDISLGAFLVAFFAGRRLGGVPVGADYDCDTDIAPSEWTRLCHTVIDIIDSQDAPEHLFGVGAARRKTIGFRTAAFLYAREHGAGQEVLRLVDMLAKGPTSPLLGNWLMWKRARIDDDPRKRVALMGTRGRARNWPSWGHGHGRFAVLKVTLTRPEEDFEG